MAITPRSKESEGVLAVGADNWLLAGGQRDTVTRHMCQDPASSHHPVIRYQSACPIARDGVNSSSWNITHFPISISFKFDEI